MGCREQRGFQGIPWHLINGLGKNSAFPVNSQSPGKVLPCLYCEAFVFASFLCGTIDQHPVLRYLNLAFQGLAYIAGLWESLTVSIAISIWQHVTHNHLQCVYFFHIMRNPVVVSLGIVQLLQEISLCLGSLFKMAILPPDIRTVLQVEEDWKEEGIKACAGWISLFNR